MDQGWVKFHRQLLDNHFLMGDPNAFIVFAKLLLMVNSKGEYATGRRQLAELLYMNDRTLYGVLLRLENEGVIRLESRVRYTVICVQKWNIYQQTNNRGSKRTATDRATLAKQGSFDELATEFSTTAQPQRNHSATTAQHSNKNKKENKNKEGRSKIDQQLAAKEKAAVEREPGPGLKRAAAVADMLKERMLKKV